MPSRLYRYTDLYDRIAENPEGTVLMLEPGVDFMNPVGQFRPSLLSGLKARGINARSSIREGNLYIRIISNINTVGSNSPNGQ